MRSMESLQNRSTRGNLSKLAAPALACLALTGMAEAQPAQAASSLPATQAKAALKTLRQTKGYPQKVSSKLRREVENSTVTVGYNTLNYTQTGVPFYELCKGLKVFAGKPRTSYVNTAAHCFSQITGSEFGNVKDTAAPLNKAENYVNGGYAYGILDPLAPQLTRDNSPVALVSGISIAVNRKRGLDRALLQLSPQNVSGKGERSYGTIRSVAASKIINSDEKILPGEPIALPSGKATQTVRYIGRFSTAAITGAGGGIGNRMMDWAIAPNPASPNNPGRRGQSGESGVLPSGQFTGDLSLSEASFGDTPAIRHLQAKSHIKLVGRNVEILGFAVEPPRDTQTMIAGLSRMHQF